MRTMALAAGCLLACLMAGQAYAEGASESVKRGEPRVYALIAAVGEEFTVVSDVMVTGSHLPNYRRRTSEVQNNILNRIALNGLDSAIASIDPASKRIYMSLVAVPMDRVAPSKRDEVAIGAVVAELKKMPDRAQWERIVVATPAYRALDVDGMPSRLQGFGVFSERLCKAGCANPLGGIPRELAPEPLDGVDAVTMDDEKIKARTFLAPFSYIAVWVLDPKTLAVLDKQQGFDNQKLAERHHKPALDLSQIDAQQYLVGRIVTLINTSIGAAVMNSELNERRGKVEVGEPELVDPSAPKK
jgi:hypothetical protein